MTIGEIADYLKVGGTWRFSRADIEVWIKQQSMEAIEPTNKDSGEHS